MKLGFGKSTSNFLMLIHTSPHLLGLWTRYIIQMLMNCEQARPHLVWLSTSLRLLCYHSRVTADSYFYEVGFFSMVLKLLSTCRSGSVCLDVINQTWSPMFGNFIPIVILLIQAQNLTWMLTDKFFFFFFTSFFLHTSVFQTYWMFLKFSFHSFCSIPILQTPLMVTQRL